MEKIGKWKSEHVQKLEDEEELHGTRVTFSVFARRQRCEIASLLKLETSHFHVSENSTPHFLNFSQ